MTGIVETITWSGHGFKNKLRRWSHRSRLAPLDRRDAAVLNTLQCDGGCSSSLADLGVPGSDEMLAASDRLMAAMERLPKREGTKSYVSAAPPELIGAYPEIIRWGLDERLLTIVEQYLGMPVAYRGVLARLDFPDGQVEETRLWHLDQEDERILKIVVYLNDVGPDGGPFEYIPASASPPLGLARGPKLRVDNEAALAAAVPASRWKAVMGPRGTVGFADTCRVLHRGRLPTAATRKTLFYAYNTRWPYRPSYCEPMFPVERFLAQAGPLNDRQRDAVRFQYA